MKKVQITGGPNLQFIMITLIIFLIGWQYGLIWLGGWLFFVCVAVICFAFQGD